MSKLSHSIQAILVAGAILFNVVSARSEPGPAMKHLMNTPVSSLTFGLHLTNLYFRQFDEKYKTLTSATYDWKSDLVTVTVYCLDCGLPLSEATCAELIEGVRARSCIQGGKSIRPLSNDSCLANNFLPYGYVNTNAPSALGRQIDQRIRIVATLLPKDRTPMTCRGDLLGTGYSIDR